MHGSFHYLYKPSAALYNEKRLFNFAAERMQAPMKKTVALFCCMLCVLLCACGGRGLEGKWQNDAAPIVYDFMADGTVSISISDQEPTNGTYTVDKEAGQLTIEYDGFETVVTYTLNGNTLTCVDYNGTAVTLTRIQ